MRTIAQSDTMSFIFINHLFLPIIKRYIGLTAKIYIRIHMKDWAVSVDPITEPIQFAGTSWSAVVSAAWSPVSRTAEPQPILPSSKWPRALFHMEERLTVIPFTEHGRSPSPGDRQPLWWRRLISCRLPPLRRGAAAPLSQGELPRIIVSRAHHSIQDGLDVLLGQLRRVGQTLNHLRYLRDALFQLALQAHLHRLRANSDISERFACCGSGGTMDEDGQVPQAPTSSNFTTGPSISARRTSPLEINENHYQQANPNELTIILPVRLQVRSHFIEHLFHIFHRKRQLIITIILHIGKLVLKKNWCYLKYFVVVVVNILIQFLSRRIERWNNIILFNTNSFWRWIVKRHPNWPATLLQQVKDKS